VADLRANASKSAAALRTGGAATPTAGIDQPATPDIDTLPDIEYTGVLETAEQVPVWVAWARVMADVQTIAKRDKREAGDGAGKGYLFRGVDTVINAVGPALRRHGVLVLPEEIVTIEYRETRTSKGTVMQECIVRVRWSVIGPSGDRLAGTIESAGQANDTGDKATAKAMSVAQRVLFLTSLHVPTDDPTIDQGHDRGERPIPAPNDYRDEIVHPDTSLNRLKTIRSELLRLGLGGYEVTNEVGDQEALIPMIDRIGLERRGGGAAGGDPS